MNTSAYGDPAAEEASPHATQDREGAIGALRRVFASLKTEPADRPETLETDGSAAAQSETATLGAILDGMHERAFGLLLLLFALPCCIPFLYGVPQIMALPLLALAGQLAAGRDVPWLPQRLRARRAPIATLENVLDRSEKYVGWFEKIARPRLLGLSDRTGARVVGALMLIPCASILTPLPATNTTPGIAVAVIAVGLMERDGLMILAGLALGLAWVGALITVAALFGLSALGSLREVLAHAF